MRSTFIDFVVAGSCFQQHTEGLVFDPAKQKIGRGAFGLADVLPKLRDGVKCLIEWLVHRIAIDGGGLGPCRPVLR